MLRKFKIAIDGKEYLVEMEEIVGVPQPAAPQPVAAPVAVETPKVEEAAPVQAVSEPAGADALTAVTENQPLMILEAMKMENEVVANKAGKITGIHVNQGQVVNPGDALITIN